MTPSLSPNEAEIDAAKQNMGYATHGPAVSVPEEVSLGRILAAIPPRAWVMISLMALALAIWALVAS